MKITVYDGKERYELPFQEGESILTVLQKGKIQNIAAPCGGKGTCKKCRVFVQSRTENGVCLACETPAEDGMIVQLHTEDRVSFALEGADPFCLPAPGGSGYAAACDIGTTAVVCQLVDLQNGSVISSISGSSRAAMYGSNVLALLDAASSGLADTIHDLLISQVNDSIRCLCGDNHLKPEDMKLVSVTGNTVMMHFFAGLDPSEKGTSPFVPVSLFGETGGGRQLGLEADVPVYLCPAVSGFIGSDVVCGLFSCGALLSDQPLLFIDIGTNTEIVLGSRDGFSACSADGGAVFKASLLENGMTASAGAISGVKFSDGKLILEVLGHSEPKGICGSGFIDVIGIMYENGALDEIGHIADPDEADDAIAAYIGEREGRPVFFLTEDHTLYISEADISQFQLAKAAVYAGIQVLLKERGITLDQVARLYLGGGFGAFAHRRSSALLGIIPQSCKGKTFKMGNTALAGAVSAALSEECRQQLCRIRDSIQTIDLPKHKDFNDLYMDGMLFE